MTLLSIHFKSTLFVLEYEFIILLFIICYACYTILSSLCIQNHVSYLHCAYKFMCNTFMVYTYNYSYPPMLMPKYSIFASKSIL